MDKNELFTAFDDVSNNLMENFAQVELMKNACLTWMRRCQPSPPVRDEGIWSPSMRMAFMSATMTMANAGMTMRTVSFVWSY